MSGFTTSSSVQLIINSFLDYIKPFGGYFSDWYVGIAEDPEKRLFEDHNVAKNGDSWIYREAQSSQEAREVEKYSVDTLGTDGGPGGGGPNTKYVYAYKKNSHTKP